MKGLSLTLPMKRITKLGLSFDKEAALYHAVRPDYPDVLFDDLIAATGLAAQAEIVEIGPGTGQATKSFAKRSFNITGVEIGESLAEIARSELSPYPNVDIVTGAFEDVELPLQSFDLVFSAISFHWIKPGWKYLKPHNILKNTGHLAIVHTHPVTDGKGDQFFHASQRIYQKYFPKSNNLKFVLPTPNEIQPYKLDENLFALSHFQTFPSQIHYSAIEYRRFVNTHSPTLQLPADKRNEFLSAIQHLIESTFDNRIERCFSISLTVARKIL